MKRLTTLLTSSMLLFAAYAMAQGPGGPPPGAPGAGPGGPGGGRGPAGPPPPPPRVVIVHEADVAGRLVSYPMDVMSIINAKCISCHSPSARGQGAKRDLQFETLQEMTGATAKLVLDSIKYDVTEKKMPPARAVERNPSLALTPEEADKLKAWVDETLAKIK